MTDSYKNNVHDAHINATLRDLHGAILDIVGLMNGPQRDEMLIREAGIRLDRALFPLLVLVERLGPIGVVELADRVGRDYTTVSRQLARLDALGLITRTADAEDRRVRRATIAAPGKAMTDRIDAARERVLSHGFRNWDIGEIEALAGLARKLADTMRADER